MATREIVALNESVPQLQVPGASDTYLMARDMDGGGNDITNLGEVTTNTVNGGIPLHAINGIDTDLPIIILCIGDSNMQGGLETTLGLQFPNSDVWNYATPGATGVPQDLALLGWGQYSPDDTFQTDYPPNGLKPYWGFLRGGAGTTSWAIADRVQRATKRPVGLITVARGGTTSDYWLSYGSDNDGYLSLSTYLSSAIASFTPPGYPTPASYASIVVFADASNELLINDAQTFTNNMKSIHEAYSSVDSNTDSNGMTWTRQDKTLWLHIGPNQAKTGYANNAWLGMQYLDSQTSEYVRVISTVGIENLDNTHWTNAGYNELGIKAADIALKGLQPKTTVEHGAFLERRAPVLGGNLEVNGNKIVSASNGNIDIEPNGTGNVLLGNFTFNADQTVGAGQDNYLLTYNNSATTIELEPLDISFDTSPTLGGDLAGGGYDITGVVDLTHTGAYIGGSTSVSLASAGATLTASYNFVELTGTLTANRTVTLPSYTGISGFDLFIYNGCVTGAYLVTIDGSGSQVFKQNTVPNHDAWYLNCYIAQNEVIHLRASITGGWLFVTRSLAPEAWSYRTTSGTGNNIMHHQRKTIINVAASGTSTYNLPAYYECYGMGDFIIKNLGGGICTVGSQYAGSWFIGSSTTATSTDTLAPGEVGIYNASSSIVGVTGSIDGWIILNTGLAS